MNFIEQLTEKSKLVIANTREERLDNIVKLCVAETAKEILESQNGSISSNSSWVLMNNKCQYLITQAEKTE